ncbi:hypothetical protein Tco_0161535 [Tanacetum coccineum]
MKTWDRGDALGRIASQVWKPQRSDHAGTVNGSVIVIQASQPICQGEGGVWPQDTSSQTQSPLADRQYSEDFHQIVDFLNTSHIKYAITENPTIHVSLIQSFWQTASASTSENGEMEITATIDGKVKTVTKESIRRHLKLEDSDGISTLPKTEIFKQLALIGYVSKSDKLTFQKGHFSPQWRFLIHTILYSLSPKKTSREQFSSNITTAIICLAINRTFNFSRMIFEVMMKNLDSKSKFLMYPRFIQIFLNKHKRLVLPHNRTYIAPTLTHKLFSNMRRASKGYTRVDIPLFPTMLVQGPNLQGQGSTVQKAATLTYNSPLPRVHSLGSDEGSMPLHELIVLYTTLSKKVKSLEFDLKQTKLTYGAAFTKLIMKVKRLEKEVKLNKARRRAKIVVSNDEDAEKDTSKQGRSMIEDIDQDAGVSLVQIDAKDQGSTAGALMPVSTAGMDQGINIIIPSSSETTKDKGKAIMKESEQPKKIKKRVQIQMSLDEELAQKLYKEEQARFNAEQEAKFKAEQEELLANEEKENLSIEERARLFAELIDKRKKLQVAQRYEAIRNKPQTMSQQRKTMCTYMKNMVGYKMEHFKGKSFYEVKEIIKRAGLNLQEESLKRQKTGEGSKPTEELKANEISQEDLQQMIMVVPVEEVYVEALQVKYPIIDWEVYSEDTRKYWKIIRKDSVQQILTDDKERTLWVELKRLFEPDTDDILWKLQREYDIFMLVEKDYPLTRGLLTLMMYNKLQMDQYSELANELLRKIVILANKPRQSSVWKHPLFTEGLIKKLDDLKVNHKFRGGLLGIKGFYKFLLLVQVSTAKRKLTTGST